MKPTEINHPLRTIKLKYNSDKELSEIESEAIAAYIKLHSRLDGLSKRHKKLAGELAKNEHALYEASEQAGDLDIMLMRCGPLAGYTDEEIERLGIKGGEVDVTEIFDFVNQVIPVFTNIFNSVTELHDKLLEWQKDHVSFQDAVDEFDEQFFSPIIADYENVEIDTVAFDEDVQEFYGFCDNLSFKEYDDFMALYNDHIEGYNLFNSNVDTHYRRIEKLQEAINNPPIPPIHLN